MSLGGTIAAYAANVDGKEVFVQKSIGEKAAINFNDVQQLDGIQGTEANISVNVNEDGIEGLQKAQVVEPYASGSLSAGSSTTFDKQYLTSGDTVTIAVTSSVVATVNTSGYYYIYIKNVSTGSTNFTCDYVVN